jgi:hypothetical protein
VRMMDMGKLLCLGDNIVRDLLCRLVERLSNVAHDAII